MKKKSEISVSTYGENHQGEKKRVIELKNTVDR